MLIGVCFYTDQLKIECDPDEEGQAVWYPHVIVENGFDVFDFNEVKASRMHSKRRTE